MTAGLYYGVRRLRGGSGQPWDPVFADTPANAALAWAKEQGLDESVIVQVIPLVDKVTVVELRKQPPTFEAWVQP